MEHPGERGARLAGAFFYFADRKNRVVRVDLFFDGDHGAGALVLAQAKAESGTRWELNRGGRTEVRGPFGVKKLKIKKGRSGKRGHGDQ